MERQRDPRRPAQRVSGLAGSGATRHPDHQRNQSLARPDALLFPDGYKTYWASAKKKGYSGVALFTRHEPERVTIGLGIDEYDDEGRTITADYGDFVLVGAYFPNGGMKNERVPFKMSYKAVFLEHVERLRADAEFDGVRVTPLLIAAKALILAIQRNPAISAAWDEQAQEIVYKHYINLGIAAATPRGLVSQPPTRNPLTPSYSTSYTSTPAQ